MCTDNDFPPYEDLLVRTVPTCEATTNRTRVRASGYGMEYVPCGQSVGLTSFIDINGKIRRHCSIEGHRYIVERKYGVADPAEPDWNMPESADPITLAKAAADR